MGTQMQSPGWICERRLQRGRSRTAPAQGGACVRVLGFPGTRFENSWSAAFQTRKVFRRTDSIGDFWEEISGGAAGPEGEVGSSGRGRVAGAGLPGPGQRRRNGAVCRRVCNHSGCAVSAVPAVAELLGRAGAGGHAPQPLGATGRAGVRATGGISGCPQGRETSPGAAVAVRGSWPRSPWGLEPKPPSVGGGRVIAPH